MSEYRTILLRAVAALETNTAQSRNALYERARSVLEDHLGGADLPLPTATVTAERATLETAIDQVETEILRPGQPRGDVEGENDDRPARPAGILNGERLLPLAVLSVMAAAAALAAGLAIYAYLAAQPARAATSDAVWKTGLADQQPGRSAAAISAAPPGPAAAASGR